MSVVSLLRIGAVLCVVGGVAGMVGYLLAPFPPMDVKQQVASATFVAGYGLAALGGHLVVLGLPAVYALIAGRGGVPGLIGFLFLMLGAMGVGYVNSLLNLLVKPWAVGHPIPIDALNSGPPASMVYLFGCAFILLIGAIVFGVVNIRTQTYSRWPSIALIVSGIGVILWPQVGVSLFFASVAWYGVELWTRTKSALLVDEAGTPQPS